MNSSPRERKKYPYQPLDRLGSSSVFSKLSHNHFLLIACLCTTALVYLLFNTVKNNSKATNKGVKVSTWNVASINNNPFEYFMDVDEEYRESYETLMTSMEALIENPGSLDKPLSQVLSPEMESELFKKMEELDMPFVDQVKEEWTNVYSQKLLISQFLTDASLGAKRLVSMPDRVTNTIRHDKAIYYRPASINCYKTPYYSKGEFWNQWLDFMFTRTYDDFTPAESLKAISKTKYPAITEEESAISTNLEILIMALFDVSLFEVIHNIFNDLDDFHNLRNHICTNVNENKNKKIIKILLSAYKTQDVIFLQEVSTDLINLMNKALPLSFRYQIHRPEKLSKSHQSSIILIKKTGKFGQQKSVLEVSDQILELLPVKGLVDDGDFYAIKLENENMLLASFHGDTNGLVTIPIVDALSNYLSFDNHKELSFIFGLDANTYAHPIPGKKQGFLPFIEYLRKLDFGSFWETDGINFPSVHNHTTYNARTSLQPQLNKAIKKEDILKDGDVNPKDFVIFYKKDFCNMAFIKDNTGHRKFKEDTVFPSSTFPSDHAIVSTVLTRKELD